MSTELEGSISAVTEAATIATLARDGVEPKPVEAGELFAVPDGRSGVKVIDTDKYADAPRRPQGKRSISDAASFVGYVNRHKTFGTEVYAHILSSKVIAIIDSHVGTSQPAGWQEHTITLDLEHSKEWIAWTAHDLATVKDGWFSQEEFADFIEDRALDVIEPDHATLLEIAKKFNAHRSAAFDSSIDNGSGDVKFNFSETTTAKVGQKGDIEVPKELRLALRPYIGGPRVYVYAQFRYRLNNGHLRLGYALVRPEVILETAFADIVTEIREGKTVTRPASESADGTSGEAASVTRIHEGIGAVPIFYGKPSTS